MSDRVHSFTVALEAAVSEEEAKEIAAAIARLRGVVDVAPQVADGTFYVAKEQAKSDLRRSLMDVLWPRREP